MNSQAVGILRQLLIAVFSGTSYSTFLQGETLEGILASILGVATIAWGILSKKQDVSRKVMWSSMLHYVISGVSGFLFAVGQHYQATPNQQVLGLGLLLVSSVLSSLSKENANPDQS